MGCSFQEFTPKRPEGMHRELYSLLCADGGKRFDELAPLYPIDSSGGGYQKKLKLGAKKARPWKWTPFTNPARKDNSVFYHWKRIGDEPKEYPFAKFNKAPQVTTYSDQEYATHLDTAPNWTRSQTDHLIDLCQRFNLRFVVIQDRWDKTVYGQKSVEDIKERYYSIANIIQKIRTPPGTEPTKGYNFDADHERRRKEQLSKLWSRTPEQVEEEEFLRAEIKKIEQRKRERDKKTQDLQKLITAADAGAMADSILMGPPSTPGVTPLKRQGSSDRKGSQSLLNQAKKNLKGSKNMQALRSGSGGALGAGGGGAPVPDVFQGIKWPEFKTAFVRSQKMKLPGSVGQKKLKALELILQKLRVDLNHIPTEDVVQAFNDLRSDIVLLYELKSMLAACDMEIQSVLHQYEAITEKKLDVPQELLQEQSMLVQSFETGGPGRTSQAQQQQQSQAGGPGTPSLAASLGVNDLDLPSVSRQT